MKLKIEEVTPIINLYDSKIKDLTGSQFALTTAFKFANFIYQLKQKQQFLYEKRDNIIKQYAERDEQGNFVYVDEAAGTIKIAEPEKAAEELSELNSFEFDIDLEPFKMDDFLSLANILTLEDIMVLVPITQK